MEQVLSIKIWAFFQSFSIKGFIVVGNDDESSWGSASSCKNLNLMLNCNDDSISIFYNKVDTLNIEIAGHSQGSVEQLT